ncbi:MAG TPA: hypothetical protein VK066_13285 [Chloroflexota bacterium]|nr:hypothetical protein [Chloroflexota bacterium]
MRTDNIPLNLDRFVTVSEAARALDLSAQMVRLLALEGRLVATRTPYGRLISRESLAAEVARRAERAGAGGGRHDA